MPGVGVQRVLRLVAAVSCGLLLFVAFPPVEGTEAAWVALIPLMLLARYSAPGQAFGWGFAAGMVFWLLTMSWLLRLSITGGFLPLVVLGWVALCAYCALYMGAFALIVALLWRRRDEGGVARPGWGISAGLRDLWLLVALPVAWAGLEYVRATIFTGFPWNALAISQFRNIALIQSAAWGGVYLVSAVVVLLNTALAMTAESLVTGHRMGGSSRIHVELMAGLLVCALFWMQGARVVRRLDRQGVGSSEAVVAVVQPSIPQHRKWTVEAIDEIYRTLQAQTEYALIFSNHVDLIVWPETALPGPVNSDPQSAAFARALGSRGVPLLVGSLEIVAAERPAWEGEETFYNSSVLYDGAGATAGVYRKRHLVLFGEYLPFGQWLPVLRRMAPLGFVCTPGRESTVLKLPRTDTPFSVLICFEDIMPYLARDAVQAGARLLINQTNDAWFDGWYGVGWAARQHASHCVFRCVENRVPAVRAANTGVSCFIDRTGRIEDVAVLESQDWDMEVEGYKLSSLRVGAESDPLSGYTRHGDLRFGLPCAIAACAMLALGCGRRF